MQHVMTVGKTIDSTFDQAMHRCKALKQDVLVVDGKNKPIMHFKAPSGQYSEIMVPGLKAPLGQMAISTALDKGLMSPTTKRQLSANLAMGRMYEDFDSRQKH